MVSSITTNFSFVTLPLESSGSKAIMRWNDGDIGCSSLAAKSRLIVAISMISGASMFLEAIEAKYLSAMLPARCSVSSLYSFALCKF